MLDALFSVGGGWSLDVYGEAHDPAYRERLERRVAGMPVRLRGAFGPSDLERVEADYAVFPSLCHESYGLVVDEAACLGLPILAADLPSYRDHAPADSSAFFAPGDAGDLARLLVDEESLAALVRPTRPALLDSDALAGKLLEDYRAVRESKQLTEVQALMTPERRARALFRRAERRLVSALSEREGPPPAPPEEFFGGDQTLSG